MGTTATKVVAFGLGSPWRHAASREYPLLEPQPGWQVQDPDTVLGAVSEAVVGSAVIRAYGVGGRTQEKLDETIDSYQRAQRRALRMSVTM